MTTPVNRVTGIGPKTAEFLQRKGIDSVEALLACGHEGLLDAPGFSEGRAKNVLQAAAELLGALAPEGATRDTDSDKVKSGKKSGKKKKDSKGKDKKAKNKTKKGDKAADKKNKKDKKKKKKKK